ncbi:MAG: hypothetical protein JXA91_01585 [Candidatus Thermoplasmatota archaeon]|nr:hypothetical protein [Candidatus Thermoplasmatota archaeon]
MRINSKEVAILIMFLFLMALVVPIANSYTPEVLPPVTSIFFDEYSGMVTLIAVSYPLTEGSGVNATYYKIDGGSQIKYTEPFKLPEGTHTIEYWSIGNNGKIENRKTKTFTYDSIPPTVEITSPKVKGIYIHGNFITQRIFGTKTLCIGKVPIEVNADDSDGYGVKTVFFKFSNGDTGYDDNATDGWTYNFNNAHFGELEITVTAMDKKELMSEPYTITINVYSLGIL